MPVDTVTPAAPPRDTYLVIVAGAMNPMIHHAQWYRAIGAVDEAEFQSAIQSPNSGTTPLGSQVDFSLPGMIVVCQPGQWWIQSTDAKLWTRMLDVAALVFERLPETPVSTYGLMSQRHIDTNATNITSALGARIASLGLGLSQGSKSTQSTILLTVLEGDVEVAVTIQPSVLSARAVFGAYNRKFFTPKGFEYFDVGTLLKERHGVFLSSSDKFFADLVTDINTHSLGGKL